MAQYNDFDMDKAAEKSRPKGQKDINRKSNNSSKNRRNKKRTGKKKSRKAKRIWGNIISFLVAVILVFVVGYISFGSRIKESRENGEEIGVRWLLGLIYPDKYAYSSDLMNLNEYFQLFSNDDVAIVLQNEKIEDKGKLIDGKVYFSLDTVSSLLTKRFYYNDVENNLLYTTSDSVIKADITEGTKGYYVNGAFTEADYVPAVSVNDIVYVCADYVKKYNNFSYEYYSDPNRVQLNTVFDKHNEAKVLKKTKVRYQGGIKSDVLCNLEADDSVTVLESMENWTKVKTKDCFIGYVENTKLSELEVVNETAPVGAYVAKEDYLSNPSSDTIILGWHQIYFADDGANLNSILPDNACINVVSPTWFYVNSEKGEFDNYSSSAYVTNAHNKGLKVWALCEDMTNDFDEYALFSSSENRKNFINNLVNATLAAGADGINIDFEKIGKKTGPHFVQFLRELSIETKKNGLVLSADNYQQNQGNLYYNLGEQGLVCDYVIIMDYDEHWAGSQEAGSVASIGFVERGIASALEAGVPPYKLINGVPFYTRLWREEGDRISSNALGMNEAKEWVNNRNLTPVIDEETGQYYVTCQDGTAVYEMWLEEATSMSAKLTVGKNNNIAGVACWRLGLENSEIWSTIAEYYK